MNTLTDTLNFVKQENGHGTFHLFKRKRAEQYGFTLVIFRKQALLGYISSSDISVEGDILRRYDRLGIKDGDSILSINLGPQRLKISETLPTQDHWTRYYELELDIAVNDPLLFAQRYIQLSDPVQWAKTAIEGFIQYSAGFWNHDDISETMLREWTFQALTVPQNTTSGLRVVAVHKALLPMHPDREKEIQIERQRKIEEIQIHKDGYIQRVRKEESLNLEQMSLQGQLDIDRLRIEEQRKNLESQISFERAEDLKLREHENTKMLADLDEQLKRQQKTFQLQLQSTDQQSTINLRTLVEEIRQQEQRHQIEKAQQKHQLSLDTQKWEDVMRKQIFEKIGEGTMPILIARIREQILDERSTLNQAASEPELRYLLDILSGGANPGTPLPLLTMPQNTSDETPVSRISSVNENQTNSSLPNSVTGQFHVVKTLPGVVHQTEETVEIPDFGMKLIPTTFSDELHIKAGTATPSGFIVYMLNEHGLASQSLLQVADIIIAINEHDIQNVQDISQAVSTRENGGEVLLYILRGQELKELKLKTPR